MRQYLNDPDLMFRRFRYKDDQGRWQTKWKKRIADPDRPGRYRFIDYDKDSYRDQWTGRGYYKSSAQNAMRVARTETNIAYRRADHERWQQLDFVIGQRVQLSKKHPCPDICDTLAGDYPKDFVFDGWHPQCFCFVTPILIDQKEIEQMNEAFARGEEYTPKAGQITEYPQGFKDFCIDNADKIRDARLRGTEPYFVRNNADVVERIINQTAANALNNEQIDKFAEILKKSTESWSWQDMEQWMEMSIEDRIEALRRSEVSGFVPDDFFDTDSMYADIYKTVNKDSLLGEIDDVLTNIANGYDLTDMDGYLAFYSNGRMISTRADDYELEGVKKLPRKGLIALMTNGGVLDNRYWVKNAEGLAAIQKYTGYKTVEKGVIVDGAKRASLKGSNLLECVCDDSSLLLKPTPVKSISHIETQVLGILKSHTNIYGNKIKGIIAISQETAFANTSEGVIRINFAESIEGFNQGESLLSAFDKIKRGKQLTRHEEYSIEVLWHEILHNKSQNTAILPIIDSPQGFARAAMETVNQLVARYTYGDFLKLLGGKAEHTEWILGNGYGYHSTVANLRKLLSAANIDEKSFIKAIESDLMNDYTDFDKKVEKVLRKLYKGEKDITYVFQSIEFKGFDEKLKIILD